MRSVIRLCLFPLVSVLLLVAPTLALQIRFFPDFSSPNSANHLRLNGNSGLNTWQSQTVLRLSDGASGAEQSATYFNVQQPLTQGFTTWFQFQVHNPMICCAPADGFAFIIQNATNTDTTQGASGRGLTALGAANGGLGYSGINNSLAIEFDLYGDPWDPNSNHISIQTCGGNPSLFNSPVHLPGSYTIGNNHNVTSCLLSQAAINTNIPQLGGTCNEGSCSDGAMHQVVIDYAPPAPNQQQGLLQVWLDPTFLPGSHTPIPGAPTVLSVPYNIIYSPTNPAGLAPGNNKGGFWVGFTGSQPDPSLQMGTSATQDIFGWEFTAHAPTAIQQQIQPGGTQTTFVFGAHQMAVNYPTGFGNPNHILMTVLETPWNQQTFYNQRLLGTAFANENCIIYLGTGGDCIVYSVTCQDQNGNNVTCPTEPDPTIAMCTKFYTAEPLTPFTVDYIRAEPIGSNNWCSIFNGFSNNNDPVVSGKGRGLSDFVATFAPHGQGPMCQDSLAKAVQKVISPPSGSEYCPPIQ